MDPLRGRTIRHPSTQGTKHRWHFRNDTGTEICDFHFDTNRTWGDDPDLLNVEITSPDELDDYLPATDVGDTATVAVRLTECIPKDAEFAITIEFDATFDSDESIEIAPSDRHGAILETTLSEETALAASEPQKQWSWGEFLAWTIGGAVGAALGGGLLNWWTGPAVLASLLFGGLGGAVGGMLGVLLTYLFDAPRIDFRIRAAFLFGFWFSAAITLVLGLLASDLFIEIDRTGEEEFKLMAGIGFVAGLLAASLAGLLNNLRRDHQR